MADNFSIDPGASPSIPIAADEVAAKQVQFVKLMDGADGSGAVIQGTAEYGLEVDVVRQAALPAGSAIVGQVGLDQSTPGTTNKVSIGTDGEVVLKAGTAAIGKLAANSGVDIGDVDVASVAPGTGATNLGKAEDAAHTSGDVGVMALAVRKDSPTAGATTDGDYEALHTNAAGRLYVSSTVDAALPAGTNNIGDVDVLSLPPLPTGDNMIGAVDVISICEIPAGNNNIGNVDIVTMPSVVLAAGTAAVGKLAANSGVDIGDVDVTSLPALPAGSNVIGEVKIASQGKTYVRKSVDVIASQSGATIWDPTAGLKLCITQLVFNAWTATAGQYLLFFFGTDSATARVAPKSYILPGGGLVMEWPEDAPCMGAVASILKYTTGSGTTGNVYVEGWTEA